MIQQAVQDDLLRYHKTLLVWTNKISTQEELWNTNTSNTEGDSEQSALIREELDQIKKSLIDILREHKNGVSLAQLPQYLKRKLHFDLNLQKLGYPKLKDLILSMSD